MNCDPSPEIHVFPDATRLAQALAEEWVRRLNDPPDSIQPFSLVLSGGSTPRALYREISKPQMIRRIPWSRVHFFWGDERCVPSDHDQSNFRMSWEALLKYLPVPQESIHRIRGEEDPMQEAERYCREMDGFFSREGGTEGFDWVFLGLGTDGHTASLFPGQSLERGTGNHCGVAEHPETGQKRISLTLDTINRSRRVTFIVTGKDKADRVFDILRDLEAKEKFPAGKVQAGKMEWYLDEAAAFRLQE